MFCSFEQVLESSPAAESLQCLANLMRPCLRSICDVRQLGEECFFRLSDQRVRPMQK